MTRAEARRLLIVGSPAYRTALCKLVRGGPLTEAERQILRAARHRGGYPIPAGFYMARSAP